MSNVVLAITGASGSIYGIRLLQVLLASGRNVELLISPAAVQVMQTELGLKPDLENFSLDQLILQEDVLPGEPGLPRSPGGSSILRPVPTLAHVPGDRITSSAENRSIPASSPGP